MSSMNLKLAGYEMAPQEQYHRDLMAYSSRVAEGGPVDNPPMAAKPVYADAEGNHYVGLPTEDGVVAMPFIPGSPAQGSSGGFVPVEQMPQGGVGDDWGGLRGAMAEGMPVGNVVNWTGSAATNGMLAGASGTGTAGALSTLGLSNPMAQGALGAAVTAAGNSAGLGPLTGLLNSALSGGGAGAAGGQVANLASILTNGGGFTGALDQAASTIGGMLGGGLPNLGGIDSGLGIKMDGVNPEGALNTLLSGKGPNVVVMDEIPKSGLPDLNAIGSQALDGAANQLLSQWKVDDESSAAEQAAHKAVMDNKDAILDAAKDPDGFIKRIKAIFSGASSEAKFPIARMGDLDVKPPYLIQVGVATILGEGKPVSRITDPLTPSGPIILEGAATVLSAGLPTARLTHTTSAPAMKIIQGAPTVLVGGPSAKVDPPAKSPDAENKSNAGPKGPEAPKKPASGSGQGGESGTGGSATNQAGDSTAGSTGSAEDDTRYFNGKGGANKGASPDTVEAAEADRPAAQSQLDATVDYLDNLQCRLGGGGSELSQNEKDLLNTYFGIDADNMSSDALQQKIGEIKDVYQNSANELRTADLVSGSDWKCTGGRAAYSNAGIEGRTLYGNDINLCEQLSNYSPKDQATILAHEAIHHGGGAGLSGPNIGDEYYYPRETGTSTDSRPSGVSADQLQHNADSYALFSQHAQSLPTQSCTPVSLPGPQPQPLPTPTAVPTPSTSASPSGSP